MTLARPGPLIQGTAMRSAVLYVVTGTLLLLVGGVGCSKNEPTKTAPAETSAADSEEATLPDKPTQAPDQFTVELDTTKGPIVIDVHREWSPHGVDRFYELVNDGYYNDVAFFRVIDGFMAQVGISGDPAENAVWRQKRIPDDPVKGSNTRGMVSFAMSGPDSRTTQFFINFTNNSNLDAMGFSPFGEVKDMTAVDALYSGYGEGAPRGRGPSQGAMQAQGNSYLKENFPKLDYIKSAKIVN